MVMAAVVVVMVAMAMVTVAMTEDKDDLNAL